MTELAEFVVNPNRVFDADFQSLFARGRAGVDTPIIVIGDSIPFGFGSRATNGLMTMNSLGPQLARALAGQGVKATANGFFGNAGNKGSTLERSDYDGRISGATDWKTGVDTLGGRSFFAQSGADPLPTFTPSEPVDTIIQYYRRAGGAGTFSYAIDGGSATNVSTNSGTTGLFQTATAVALGAHSVAQAHVSGDVRTYGFDAYDSAKLGLRFINACIPGAVLSDFTANTTDYDPGKIAAALGAKATILMVGANHWNPSSPDLSGFAAQLAAANTIYGALGPLILLSDPPSDPAGSAPRGSFATQKLFVDTMVDFAKANNLLMFDPWRQFGGENTNFNADYLTDHLHPDQQGHGRVVHPMARLFALA